MANILNINSHNFPKHILSLVVPCYNEALSLPLFIKEIQHIIQKLPQVTFEIIFIDDGSKDTTLKLLRQFKTEYSFVRYISFSRNFGKESAILAGLKASRGAWVAVMDADLQDPPSLLPEMLTAILEEGYDCVGTYRCTRKGEPLIRSFFARCFYKLINKISSTQLVDGARDYKLLSRKAVNALISMPEANRFSKGLYEWIGFKTKWLKYENIERVAGETKWSFWALLKYSIEGIVSFSSAPLLFSAILGILFMVISFIGISVLSIRQLIFHNSVDGWTSMICVMLMLGGVQLLCLGVMGQYMAKIYSEVKHRPNYIISEQED